MTTLTKTKALNSLSNLNNIGNNLKLNTLGYNDSILKAKALKLMLLVLLVLVFIFSIIMIVIALMHPKSAKVSELDEEVLLNCIHNCKNNPLEISTKAIPASTSGNQYSITFWIFVNNLDSRYIKNPTYPNFDILTKGPIDLSRNMIDTSKNPSINVYLKKLSSMKFFLFFLSLIYVFLLKKI